MVKKIVVVDDDRDILEFVEFALEDEGYSVEIDTGGGCFRRLQPDNLPDLILLDVNLVGEDGRDLCRQLRASDLTRRIPILLYSADDVGAQIQKDRCADDFLTKPFSLATLINKVKRLVSFQQ